MIARPCVVVSGVLLMVVGLPYHAAARSPRDGAPLTPSPHELRLDATTRMTTNVRGLDAKAEWLLKEGVARSVVFKELVRTLEQSDIIVYVQTGACRTPGQLVFAAAPSNRRYLRILIRVPGRDAVLIAWLAHELQHAAEIASAPEVTDQRSLLHFYQRIGSVDQGAGVAETGRAQEVWRAVLEEVSSSRRAQKGPGWPVVTA